MYLYLYSRPWRIMFPDARIMLCCNSLKYLYYASINFILLPQQLFLFIQYAFKCIDLITCFSVTWMVCTFVGLMPPRRFSTNVNPKLCGEDFLWLKQSRGLYRSYDATSNSYYSPFCTLYLYALSSGPFFSYYSPL